jgi:TolB protein
MVQAQWTNHYPKLDDFGHHVYLEQHELPILANGITDPAASPNGKIIAIAAKGWIWQLDLTSGIAKRLTNSSGVDSRPRWSANGKHLTFVRDFGNDTAVVIKNINSGEETLINSEAIDLDPEFSADGAYLFYTSGKSGSLNLYKRNIESGTEEQITALNQVVRNTRRVANQEGIVYLHGNGAHRVLRHRNFVSGSDEIIQAQTLAYHLSGDMHPSRALLVYSAPIDNDYHLYTMDLSDKRVEHRLTERSSFAITPTFGADGNHIYFVTLSDNRQFQLMQIPTYGGTAKKVDVKKWDFGVAKGSLAMSIFDDQKQNLVARVSIVAENGHPVANPFGATFVDPQTGRTYFYVDHTIKLDLPVGKYSVEVARGHMTKMFSTHVNIENQKTNSIDVQLSSLWDSTIAGYQSADFHVHLNGDGHHRASHKDALLQMQGENLDFLAPMSWNRWERRIDKAIIGKSSAITNYQISQGQEVRSHFHGHIGLLNVKEPFAPWFFGPNNPTLGDPNISNADVFEYANKVGAFGTYVHPVSNDGNPFAEDNINSIPLELISDGILEPKMGLELVCAWTSPLGTAQLWYRFLNIGQPVSAMSGTDGWIDFHRTPAVGTGRAYIRPVLDSDIQDPLLMGAIAGRSFVTTSPMLLFSIDEQAKPGDVINSGVHDYALTLTSTVNVDIVEIIVNGIVIDTLDGLKGNNTKTYKGQIDLPDGGWVAARAYSSERKSDSWPSMHARPFVHSSPIWIGKIGSTESNSRIAAVADLLNGLNVAEKEARAAYGTRPMPKLYARFKAARAKLQSLL